MPKRIFGSIVDSLGEENASVECHNYLEVPPLKLAKCPDDLQIVEVSPWTQSELYKLAVETRGQVHADAEELGSVDFNLSELYAEYQEVGLRRYRRGWLVLDRQSGRPLAALIAYRGPLGFNFSFLENRADLLISDHIEDERLMSERQTAINEMVRVCRPGGKVMLQDLDGQLVWHYPIDEQLQGTIQTVVDDMAKTGFDPFVGRKLFSLVKTAGLSDIDVQAEP